MAGKSTESSRRGPKGDKRDRTRATLLSMGGTVDAIGQLTGGPMIGLVGQLLSLRAAMVAVGLTLVPALPQLNRARRQAEQGAGQKAV